MVVLELRALASSRVMSKCNNIAVIVTSGKSYCFKFPRLCNLKTSHFRIIWSSCSSALAKRVRVRDVGRRMIHVTLYHMLFSGY